MNLMEYKSRELFVRFDIPAMQGIVVDDAKDLELKIDGMQFPAVVKAQVQTGGRGKAGGILFADTPAQVINATAKILGMDIKGHIVKKVLIVEKVQVLKEWYLSITLDRFSKSPTIIFSTEGGVDIEETAKISPEKILKVVIDPFVGINDYIPRYLLSKSDLDMKLFEQLFDILKRLYELFTAYDCMLVEINPLAITAERHLLALDGKITIDDSALPRQQEIVEFRDSLPEEPLVLEARKFKFLYIPCEENGSISVMSNGSGMIMSCIDMITKQGMKVGAALDLGGGATSDRIREAISIVLSNSKIKSLFINIFGGITRCDEVAAGVREAVEALSEDRLIIVRFEGTNKQKGLEILSSAKGSIVSVNSLKEGVFELAARRGIL